MFRRNKESLQFGHVVHVGNRGFENIVIPKVKEPIEKGVIVSLNPDIKIVVALPLFYSANGVEALGTFDREIPTSGIRQIVGILNTDEILERLEVGITHCSDYPVDAETMRAFIKERRANLHEQDQPIPWSPSWRISFPRLGRLIRL